MKTSPFIRIREKNKLIKAQELTLKTIAEFLPCQNNEASILLSISALKKKEKMLFTTSGELDALTTNMGEMVAKKVEENTYSLKVKNLRLETSLDKLEKIPHNEVIKKPVNINKKGFWDLLYKLLKIK